jgi:HesB-like selenoprotein
MKINISESAKRFIDKKMKFYNRDSRVPRIHLAERSCSGAVFRLFFDHPNEQDEVCVQDGYSIHIARELAQEFEGFDLDVEQFFFATRVKVLPHHQSYRCNCSQKCNNKAN